MLQMLDAILRLELIERDVALQLVRVIGSSIERIAQSHIDAIEARVDADGAADDRIVGSSPSQRRGAAAHRAPDLRVRLAAARPERRPPPDGRRRPADGQPRGVGFADLVGFTALSQQLDDRELAAAPGTSISTASGRATRPAGSAVPGRRRPANAMVRAVTFAFVSCQNFAEGYFTPYAEIANGGRHRGGHPPRRLHLRGRVTRRLILGVALPLEAAVAERSKE